MAKDRIFPFQHELVYPIMWSNQCSARPAHGKHDMFNAWQKNG